MTKKEERMKKYFKFMLVGLLIVGFSSCLDDSDYPENHWIGFGLVDINDVDETYSILMDDGEILYPLNEESLTAEDGARVFVNFTIEDENVTETVEEYYVTVYSLKEILFKGILDITPEIEDSIGNDAINVEDIWETNNMLTFEIEYFGLNQTHYINLVKEPGELTSGSEPVELELRHNDNNDSPSHKVSSFVTFDMSAIQIAGQDSTSYIINWTEYGGDVKIYEGVYYY